MKTQMYICFLLLVAADLWVTEYVIRSPFLMEGNPIMQFSIDYVPGGMLFPKVAALMGLLAFWKKIRVEVLALLCCGMAAVVANNCFLLDIYVN
tara:strand:- start:1716 stop:1997 length:282 start_codon:yes stop_codon:yes gene_type:complete